MIYAKMKDKKALNLKLNTFSYDVISFGAISLNSFFKAHGSSEIITKARLMDDIVNCTFHNKQLEYAIEDKTLNLQDASKISKYLLRFLGYELFYFNCYVDEHSKALKTYIKNKIQLDIIYDKNNTEAFTELKSKYEIEKYQLFAIKSLLNQVSIELLDENVGNPYKIQSSIFHYYFELITNKIRTSQNIPNNPINNERLNYIKDFLNKDELFLKVLSDNLISLNLKSDNYIDLQSCPYGDFNNIIKLNEILQTLILECIDKGYLPK